MAQPPTDRSLDLLIVGAGFGGLYMLHKARAPGPERAGARSARPASAAPGTTTAIPARASTSRAWSIRSSFYEALQQEWHWSERYASQPELLRYANHVADRFGLRDGIRLNTRVTGAQFDEAAQRWRVRTRGRRALDARASW